MDAILSIVMQLIAAIETLIPALGTNSAVIGGIMKILSTILTIIPLIESNLGNVITAVKNLISSIQSSGALTTEEMDAMDSFDAQVDAAYAAAAKKIGLDPRIVANPDQTVTDASASTTGTATS